MCLFMTGLFHLSVKKACVLSIKLSSFIHIEACDKISILFEAEYYSITCTYYIPFTYRLMDIGLLLTLGCYE